MTTTTVSDGLLQDALAVVVGDRRATVYRHLDAEDAGLQETGGWPFDELLSAADEAGVPVVDARTATDDLFGVDGPTMAHAPEGVHGDRVSPAEFVEWATDCGALVHNPEEAATWDE